MSGITILHPANCGRLQQFENRLTKIRVFVNGFRIFAVAQIGTYAYNHEIVVVKD